MRARKIKSMKQVKSFIKSCVEKVGLSFNPDTSFMDYEYKSVFSSKALFKSSEAAKLDLMISQCFIVCEENKHCLYKITLDAIRPRLIERNFVKIKK